MVKKYEVQVHMLHADSAFKLHKYDIPSTKLIEQTAVVGTEDV